VLVRPDFAHLWPGITIDHSGNIKAAWLREKRFVDHANHVNHASCSMRYPERTALSIPTTGEFR